MPPSEPADPPDLLVTPTALTCSAKGCRQRAEFDLQWNNPRIHTEDRRKHWLACPEHRDSLGGFLSARGFLREVVEVTAAR
jgi:hypothetical protein